MSDSNHIFVLIKTYCGDLLEASPRVSEFPGDIANLLESNLRIHGNIGNPDQLAAAGGPAAAIRRR